MRELVVGLLFVLPVLSGCMGGNESYGPPGDDPLSAAAPLGCDTNRTVIVHLPGGVPVDYEVDYLAIPCLSRTGVHSYEPTIGTTASGTVYLYPFVASISQEGAIIGGVQSTDDGATWQKVVPSLQGQPTHPTTADPYMFVDNETGRVFFDDLLPGTGCSIISWSDDEGETWDHSYSGCLEGDHQTLFAGPPVFSSTIDYPNVGYRCAYNTVALSVASTTTTCQRSLDGGRTWLPPGEPAFVTPPGGSGHLGLPYCDGGTGHGIVDDEGRILLPKGLCGQPWLAISEDEGMSWMRIQVADNGMRVDESGLIDHDAGVAVDTSGNVYYFWIAKDRLPYLATSTDGGMTWGEPLMVGTPDLVQASHPALTAGGKGKVAFAYLGSTNAPEGPWETCEIPTTEPCALMSPEYPDTTWNGYLGMSVDANDEEPSILTGAVNDPSEPLLVGYCGNSGCQETKDFIDVVIAPDGTPWASFIDGCSSTMTTCEPNDEDGNLGEAVAGRLWGGQSLWSDRGLNHSLPGEGGGP